MMVCVGCLEQLEAGRVSCDGPAKGETRKGPIESGTGSQVRVQLRRQVPLDDGRAVGLKFDQRVAVPLPAVDGKLVANRDRKAKLAAPIPQRLEPFANADLESDEGREIIT